MQANKNKQNRLTDTMGKKNLIVKLFPFRYSKFCKINNNFYAF